MVDKASPSYEKKEQVSSNPDISEEQKDLTTLQTEVDTTLLKNSIESTTDKTILTYIEGSVMHTKLKELETSGEIADFTVEKFAKDINTTVESYLRESFKISGSESLTVSETTISSMSIGIQFAMMDALTKSGSDGADFFNAFSKTDTDNASSTFTGLTKAFSSEGMFGKLFGGVGKTNQFYLLANKVESCIGFISRYCGEGKTLGDGTKVEKLANANEFRKLLDNSLRGDSTALLSKTPQDFGITVSDSVIAEMSDTDKKELKKIVDDENMPINKKTIESIMKSLPTAQKFLEKRAGYKDKAVDIMGAFTSLLDKNVFGLGTIGSIIGIQNPLELFGGKDGKKKGGVINFVLKIMGFQNGMEGLYQEYVRQTVDENLTVEGKQFIKDTLTDYDTLVAAGDSATKTITALGLTYLTADAQAKIPTEYEHIKKALYTNITESNVVLDPKVLSSMDIDVDTSEKDADGKPIVKYDTTLVTEDKIATYLKTTIPALAKNKDFMTGIKTADDFMLSLTGGMICGTCFSSAVALGMEQITGYKNVSSETTTEGGDIPVELSATGLTNCKMTDTEYKAFAEKVVTISNELGIKPEYLMKVISFETGGTLSSSIQNQSSNATGLIQFLGSTAEGLGTSLTALKNMTALEQLDIVKKYFENSIKSHGTLDSLEDVYLAVFSPAFIGKPLSYVAYYKGDAAYTQNAGFDTDKDGKMTVEEITETVRTKTKNLTFFTAAPTETAATNVDPGIETVDHETYKANTMFIGDSLTVGYAKLLKYRSLDDLLTGNQTMGGKWTGWMNDNFEKLVDADPKPKTIVLMGGINDLCNLSVQGKTSEEMTKTIFDNIEKMAEKAKAAGIQFMVGTIPPFGKFIDDPSKSGFSAENKKLFTESKDKINETLLAVNKKIKAKRGDNVIDYYTLLNDPDKTGYQKTEYSSADGVHLIMKGYQKMQDLAFEQRKKVNGGDKEAISEENVA